MNKYTKEQKEFLINNNYMKTAKELAEMFNKKFKMNLTPQNIKNFRGNYKLNSGLTGRFEKGNVPLETKGYLTGVTDITDEEMLESIKKDKNYHVLQILTKEQFEQMAYKVEK